MAKPKHVDFMRPKLIDAIEYVREVHDYKIKTRQFLQNTGKHTIAETNGLFILKATVSGLQHSMDITNTILLISKQNKCPIADFEVDTEKIDAYTFSNIEEGTRKIIEIEYMTDDVIFEEKRTRNMEIADKFVSRTYDPTDCADGIPIKPSEFEELDNSLVYLINK